MTIRLSIKHLIGQIILLSLTNALLTAQSINEIRESGLYLYGFGQSEIYEKADQMALSDLISQISVNVEDSLILIRTESSGNYKEYARSIVKTYSSATLTNALRLEEKEGGLYKVIRYISKKELHKIFDKRENAIIEYTKAGIHAESKLQIGDALRNLYWADVLLRSHPDYNIMKFYDDQDSSLLKVFVPNRINEIFSNIKIDVIEQNYKPEDKYVKYTLALKYKNQNIQNLDYTYKYKNAWSSIISANNGFAFVEYYGEDAENYKDVTFRIEYMYKDKAFFDKEVESVLSSELDLPYFSNCEIKTQLKSLSQEKNARISTDEINDVSNNIKKAIDLSLQKLITDLEQKRSKIDVSIFTNEGLDAFNKLIKYGNATLLKNDNDLKIIRVNNEFIARSIPMRFTFTKNRQFIEDVILIFDETGKINNISFSLGQIAINDILSKDERFATLEEKYFLIKFMEDYKTAYCLKNIDFIQKIFDDDALIIVGNVLKKYKSSDSFYFSGLSEDEIKYQRLTKSEYINRLKRIFTTNEFINIHFEDNVVKKANKDLSIYGIQIAQHYASDTYADKGYLFLMVDLRDTINPIIHVRTWQPRKNDDGSIYGLEDFPFMIL
ncbi:MAG: LPP20 family lipoprotein [Bacteroidales bacterium]|jgi:hypothetical protein|nr:LPP20 family lipoprotein [Bacteroidales bacterium]